MKIKLVSDWDKILKRAWSIKFSLIAMLFGIGEVIVAIMHPVNIPNGIFAGLASLVSIGAIVARTMAQPEYTKNIANEIVKELTGENHES